MYSIMSCPHWFQNKMSVYNIERKLTRGAQAKDDMAMALAPYSNWVQQVHICYKSLTCNLPMSLLGSIVTNVIQKSHMPLI